jgi:hypothetical protein
MKLGVTIRSSAIVSVCAISMLSITPAAATRFDFSQGGWAEGAVFTGSFFGEDLNHDGQISSFDGEISNAFADFSGNSLVPATHFDASELYGVVYDLDGYLGDGTTGDLEGLAFFWPSTFVIRYAVGTGPVAPCDGVNICSYINGPAAQDTSMQGLKVGVADVPEPASWAMILAGFGLIGGALRRKSVRVAFG